MRGKLACFDLADRGSNQLAELTAVFVADRRLEILDLGNTLGDRPSIVIQFGAPHVFASFPHWLFEPVGLDSAHEDKSPVDQNLFMTLGLILLRGGLADKN
jgi:hypothetical protein